MRVMRLFAFVMGMHIMAVRILMRFIMRITVSLCLMRFASMAVMPVGMRRRLLMRHWFFVRIGRCMLFMRRRVVAMRFFCMRLNRCRCIINVRIMYGIRMHRVSRFIGTRCLHDHGRTEEGRMCRFLRKITFAPIDKAVEGQCIILAPDKQSERQKEQRQTGRQNSNCFDTACQINRRHNGETRKRRHGNRQHQRLNTVGKGTQETDHNKNAEHRAQRGQTMLQGRRARVAKIELIGKRDGTFRIKDF